MRQDGHDFRGKPRLVFAGDGNQYNFVQVGNSSISLKVGILPAGQQLREAAVSAAVAATGGPNKAPTGTRVWFILARTPSPYSACRVSNRLDNTSLGQQLAIVAAGLCLLVSLALVTLAAISSKHMQLQQQQEYGSGLAHQIARRIGSALETGDLLSISASLQHFVETSAAQEVAIFDVEGKALGQAGRALGKRLRQYQAPVTIESDVAGKVVITLEADLAAAAHQRFVLSLLGLAVLLSLSVYGISRQLGQRLANRLAGMGRAIALDEEDLEHTVANEVTALARHIDALPMDLLRTRSEINPREENYRSTAVLYLHLSSLAEYVDTLDENSLHRYTDRLHQVVYAAAGFYAGDLQVSRQFGLVIYFSGANSAGSAAFRAASCAWLIKAVSRELEKRMSLSMVIAMAIGQSELGAGDGSDIYPGLYMQHTLDELQALCASKPPKILLSPAVCTDTDIDGRVQHQETELRDYSMLDAFAGPYQDLLERQLRLILKRLTDTTRL
jgi:uncharacterized membrane protein affecting hemolysin expression